MHSEKLDAVIADYLQAQAEGRAGDPEAWIARHPELADDLRAFFTDQARLEQVVAPMRQEGAEHTTLPPTGEYHPEEAATLLPGQTAPVEETIKVRYFGDYELLAEIARGGMGVVYKARQVSLNRLVALKMILAGHLAGKEEIARFRIEAEAAANLDHPHIVPIYEIGEHQGQQYFSMKYVEGGSLAAEFSRAPQARRSVRDLVASLSTITRAVHHAHQRGILHRDLKPGNVLLDQDGQPHVTDFGLAKKVEGDSGMTRTGDIVGTPSYMAPEQAAAKKGLTTAVDVYSLGAILYEMLTGRPPFREATPLDTLLQVLDKEPDPPRKYDPKVDRDLETIALKCLEKDPAKRYDSAAALADEIDRWQRGEPITARRMGRLRRALRWYRRKPLLAGTMTLAVLSLFVIGIMAGFWIWSEINARHVLFLREAAWERRNGDRAEALETLRIAAKQTGTSPRLLEEAFLAASLPEIRFLHKEPFAESAFYNLGTLPELHFVPGGERFWLIFSENGKTHAQERRFPSCDLLQETTRERAELPPPGKVPPELKVIGISQDGRWVVARKEGKPGDSLVLWDVRAERQADSMDDVFRLRGLVLVSADGQRMAFRDPWADNMLRVWDWPRARIIATFHAGVDSVTRRRQGGNDTYLRNVPGFSPDGTLLAVQGTENGVDELLVWDVEANQKLGAVQYADGPARWHPDGRHLLICGNDIPKYNLDDKDKSWPKQHSYLHTWKVICPARTFQLADEVKRLAWSGTGRLLLAGSHVFHVTATSRERMLRPIPLEVAQHQDFGFRGEEMWGVQRPAVDPNRKTLNLRRFLPTPQEILLPLAPLEPPAPVEAGAQWQASPVHFAFTSAGQHVLVLWGWALVRGNNITYTGNNVLEWWSVAERKRLAVWPLSGTSMGEGVYPSPSGRHVAVNKDGQLWLLAPAAAKPVAIFPDTGFGPTSVAFSADSSRMAFCQIIWGARTDHGRILEKMQIVFVDTATGQQLGTMPYHSSATHIALAFSPDGGRLALVDGSRDIHLIDVPGQREILRWKTEQRVIALAFSPDGEVLATGTVGGQVKLWNLRFIQEEMAKLGLAW